MGLLGAADQERLRERFAGMTRPVRLLFFTQTLGCETCLQTRQILDELPLLSGQITIEEINFVLEPDKAKQYEIDRVPAVAIVGQDESGAERDSKIRFLGAPSGYEFASLIQAVLLVGGVPGTLSAESLTRVAAVSLAGHRAGVHDADLSALSARRERGARDGVRQPQHHGLRRRGHGVSGSRPAVPGHRRPENRRDRSRQRRRSR